MNVLNDVISIVSLVVKLPVASLDGESKLNSPVEWDSLNHADIVLQLEDHFDIAFDFDELEEIISITAIVKSVEDKLI